MSTHSRRLTTWILAAWFAAVAGIGEGWHAVPGNGHWAEFPSGLSVYVGRLPQSSLDSLGLDRQATLDHGQRGPMSLKGEANCAICRISGQDRDQDTSPAVLAAGAIVQDTLVLVSRFVGTSVLRAFCARGPPLA